MEDFGRTLPCSGAGDLRLSQVIPFLTGSGLAGEPAARVQGRRRRTRRVPHGHRGRDMFRQDQVGDDDRPEDEAPLVPRPQQQLQHGRLPAPVREERVLRLPEAMQRRRGPGQGPALGPVPLPLRRRPDDHRQARQPGLVPEQQGLRRHPGRRLRGRRPRPVRARPEPPGHLLRRLPPRHRLHGWCWRPAGEGGDCDAGHGRQGRQHVERPRWPGAERKHHLAAGDRLREPIQGEVLEGHRRLVRKGEGRPHSAAGGVLLR
mmetsp:Transcript_61397/g.180096  ORF Transcript_61397/g.180096 Transcript_61397/m.180096 type:complete len:261 (-) Transcript_61397:223-1005(-)